MFSITQKPQESVNAEDLETLQNELERCLVNVVTQKWDLEREVAALSCTSPDIPSPFPSVGTLAGSSSLQTGGTSNGGKLKNSLRSNTADPSENSSDGFKTSLSSNNGIGESVSGANSNEDSLSSEGSLVSSLTSSTIINETATELGSQALSTIATNSSGIKRSHKSSSDRPSKRFRQNSSNSLASPAAGFTKRPTLSKHRSKIVPVSKLTNLFLTL